MSLKVLGVLLLVVAAVYAEDYAEAKEEVDDPRDLDDEETEISEANEDPEDDDQDEELIEDAWKKGYRPGKRLRRRPREGRYAVLASRYHQCYCRNPFYKRRKGDEPESDEAEFSEAELDESMDNTLEHVEDEAKDEEEADAEESDPGRRRRKATNKFIRHIKHITRIFFRARPIKLHCSCTNNRAVVRLLRFLHLSHVVSHINKHAFTKTLRSLMRAVYRARARRLRWLKIRKLRRGSKGSRPGKGDVL